jgi:hypothetical protein
VPDCFGRWREGASDEDVGKPVTDSNGRKQRSTASLTRFFTGAGLPRGFGVGGTAGGFRGFVMSFSDQPRRLRDMIGTFPDWSALAAVEEAEGLRADQRRIMNWPASRKAAQGSTAPYCRSLRLTLRGPLNGLADIASGKKPNGP